MEYGPWAIDNGQRTMDDLQIASSKSLYDALCACVALFMRSSFVRVDIVQCLHVHADCGWCVWLASVLGRYIPADMESARLV